MVQHMQKSSGRVRRASSLFHGLLLASAMCVLPGCFRVTALIPDTAPAERHTQWVNGFFWGAVGGTVDASRFCGGRPIASIETKRTAGNYLIELLTLGIYTPSRVAITCGQPRLPQFPAPHPYLAPPPYSPYPPPAYAPYVPPPPPAY